MNYITPLEASRKWDVSLRSVQLYCANGKIPGAVRRGRQWFIPEDAARPADGRTAPLRQAPDVEPYHFPVFVYTRYFLSFSELSEDECLLREAQLLNIRCEYAESVRCCRKLISESASPSVRFGAWFTNVLNFMFLGLSSEMTACINTLVALSESESAHREDYRLLLAFLDHTYRFNRSLYLKIDIAKLSADAMTTYKLISMGSALFSTEDTPESSVRFFEAACREAELLGIAPASLTMHAVLGMLYSRKGNMDAKLRHIDEACRIGYEGGFVRLLAKCSTLDIEAYVLCMKKYGEDFAAHVQEICHRNRSCWQLAYTEHSGSNPGIDVNLFEGEVALLLVFKTPIEDIAMLKNVTVTKVRQTIKALCMRLSLKSKKELVEYYTAVYCAAPDAEAEFASAKP